MKQIWLTRIGALIVAVLCWLPLAESSAVAQVVYSGSAAQLPIGELRVRAKSFIQKLRAAEDSDGFVAAIFDLCWLHIDVVRHRDFLTSSTLRNRRAEIATVLKKAAEEIDITIKQRDRGQTSRRIQQVPMNALGVDRSSDLAPERAKWDYLQSRWMNQWSGGPLATLGQLPGNYAPPFTDQELIALILATVSPSSWSVNGGEGTMVYYSPALALVVYNSQQVQDEIHDLLRRLR